MTNESNDQGSQEVQSELGLEETQECWFPKCSRKTIRSMVNMRSKGYPLKTIAHKSGFSEGTTARYLRAYGNYGDKPFANDD